MKGIQELVLEESEGIEQEIGKVIRKAGIPNLHDAVWYHLEAGGKRLRPALAILVCKALGGTREQALPFAAACELFHNWLLVHDDLEDGDEIRRNRPAVWKKYGMAHAINIGDYMSEKVYEILLDSKGMDDKTMLRLLREVAIVGVKTAEGQAKELNLRQRPTFMEKDYFEMVELKTGLYLALPITGGAIIAGASENMIASLKEYGRYLGPAFQITDDLLDLTRGKGRGEIGCDIKEGKRTLMAIHTLSKCSESERETLLEILGRKRSKTGTEDVNFAIGLYKQYYSMQYCSQKALDLANKAKQSVKHIPELYPLLSELADYMVNRRE